MSIRQTAESQSQSLRKRRQAEVVSFEDLLAAHQVDREPGKLPPEGVVLIGVDRELQERMRAGFPAHAGMESVGREPKLGTPNIGMSSSDTPPFEASMLSGPPGGAPEKSPLEPASRTAISMTALTKDATSNYGAPNFGTPAISALINQAAHAEAIAVEQTQPIDEMPQFGVPNLSAPDFSGPYFDGHENTPEEELDIESLVQRRTGKKTYSIQAPSRIELIMSAGELGLLRWYWENGRPIPGHPEARLVAGQNGEGSRRMATQAGLVWNTFRNYTRSLSTKHAIDIVRPESNIPRLYVVWHYSAILERLRTAGLTGVMRKNGGCRQLVDDQMRPAPQRPDLTVADLKRMFGSRKSGTAKPGTPKSGIPNSVSSEQTFGSLSVKPGMPKFGSHIRNKEYPSEKENPTTASPSGVPKFVAPKAVIDALFERTGRTDADAGKTIFKSCIDVNPSVTPEEIARLIRGFHIPASITNPVGLMIRTLPARCHAESLANYRQHWRLHDEQLARTREYERQEEERIARRVLEDPETTESELAWARGVLGR